ncbi:MAG: DUF664 domain-containing protein [Actinomycetota bacterium]
MAITVDEFLLFCHRTLDGYRDVLARLDDTLVNTTPPIPGANTPYRLVVHAMGACDWWTSHIVCGHPSERDRAAEFVASGTVAEAGAALDLAGARLDDLRPELAAAGVVHGNPSTTKPLGTEWTVGACLIHAYEELAQHLGHLEVTADVLIAERSAL